MLFDFTFMKVTSIEKVHRDATSHFCVIMLPAGFVPHAEEVVGRWLSVNGWVK